MDNAFFSNLVNSWLKDRKERTDLNIKTMVSNKNKHFLVVGIFRYASVIPNDP